MHRYIKQTSRSKTTSSSDVATYDVRGPHTRLSVSTVEVDTSTSYAAEGIRNTTKSHMEITSSVGITRGGFNNSTTITLKNTKRERDCSYLLVTTRRGRPLAVVRKCERTNRVIGPVTIRF